MKTIFLVRHAKSSWNNKFLKDQERPLNKRGLKDAEIMGERLKQNFRCPEKIICSSAQRAKETTEIIKQIWFPKKSIEFTNMLYEQPASNILSVIQNSHSELNSIALFFHNPAITYLGNLLTSLSIPNVPTCGVLTLSCKVNDWKSIEIGTCEMLDFNFPKRK
ncbi:MAG: histidine phosphatase family protein [Opitutae bacterium]|mgnify:CR=1 FL=1|jgi:phosphohistidine phosphatase|nr:histidine phosphatase family protein [Opitutae bacterium]MBT5715862.1 histidine phosphatase family protein [Opitutae bacterium]